jgi:GT2 family glycosyltransferase
MAKVLVGVHVHARPTDLAATLHALRLNTGRDCDLVLLVDGPDADLADSLKSLSHLEQSTTTEPAGAPACFNRLVTHADADWYVFLESGSIVGPGWWWEIERALQAGSTHGLAGPSTNSSWNEQCAFPSTDESNSTILRSASAASRRFGGTWQKLTPLYSLADFCYVVGRDVVRRIGAADEGYGLGPCWEMDYNIRAAHAGFDGVWARGSYVHRLASTQRRRILEEKFFDASRQRYQDKFCALKIERTSEGYEPHCKGEACPHFAPVGRIRISEPLGPISRTVLTTFADAPPLISCVMVTGGRPDFVRQAIRYFHRQDVASKELIIVDDGSCDLSEELNDRRVRYRHLDTPVSIGAKRNIGCALARGEYIAHWDDDDWYGPQRLSHQLAPLQQDVADISALRVEAFWDLVNWRFWRCSSEVHRQMFVEDVQGGTLAFRRDLWSRGLRYPDTSLAEDAAFLRTAMDAGARLARLESNGNYIYLRHGANAWSFVCGEAIDPRGWTEICEPPLLETDRSFYCSMMQQRRRYTRRLRPTARNTAGHAG